MCDLKTVHKIYYFIYFEDGVVSFITNGENIIQKRIVNVSRMEFCAS